MTNKKRNKPSFYPQKISAKINDEQYEWFWSKANSRKTSLSEFIRSLPNEVDNLNEEMSFMELDIKKLKEKIKEYIEINNLQDLIKDFKSTGKDGLILNQKKEISELTKSVMSLTGSNLRLKEEIERLRDDSVESVFLKPDDPNYDRFKEMYDKINEEESK